MKKKFKTDRLNVEKIGNIVSQLHIHIIARKKNDSSWPLSVWVVKRKPYSKKVLSKVVNKLKKEFHKTGWLQSPSTTLDKTLRDSL